MRSLRARKAESAQKDARRGRRKGDEGDADTGSNAQEQIAQTKRTRNRVETRSLAAASAVKKDVDAKERSSRSAFVSVAEAMTRRPEEVKKRVVATTSSPEGSEISVEHWNELEDLNPPRFFNGILSSPDRLVEMCAPHELSLPTASPPTSSHALPFPARDHVAVVAMLAYDVYVDPTSLTIGSAPHVDREEDVPSKSMARDRGNDPPSTALVPTTTNTTTTTTTTKPLGDVRAARREFERLRSVKRRQRQTPNQRERERIRSRERRAHMTDEQKRAAADAKSRKRVALKASKIIED